MSSWKCQTCQRFPSLPGRDVCSRCRAAELVRREPDEATHGDLLLPDTTPPARIRPPLGATFWDERLTVPDPAGPPGSRGGPRVRRRELRGYS